MRDARDEGGRVELGFCRVPDDNLSSHARPESSYAHSLVQRVEAIDLGKPVLFFK